ncbi:hypothetical protein BX592_12191 [Paraburkholderia rhizosphaerae]|uniref:Uncharacterized protein n=1 Tax=Paraburkholderia rhizosphaerae TaxID=480658 RepID=A0A4R8LI86_9BURK|nr:hypothetical protein BX592_12191 [Paraburkholderia rhizosphaerae]
MSAYARCGRGILGGTRQIGARAYKLQTPVHITRAASSIRHVRTLVDGLQVLAPHCECSRFDGLGSGMPDAECAHR